MAFVSAPSLWMGSQKPRNVAKTAREGLRIGPFKVVEYIYVLHGVSWFCIGVECIGGLYWA